MPLLALAALASLDGAARQNLGFEEVDPETGVPAAWSAFGGVIAEGALTADEREPAEGARSLRVTLESRDAVRVVQRAAASELPGPADSAGRRLRLSGLARVEPGASAVPSLWMRIDGTLGPLFLEAQGSAAEEPGAVTVASARAATAGWRRYEVELPWPGDASEVAFGVGARGVGSVWFDGLSLDAVRVAGEPAAAALRYLDAALALMREHALRAASVDWDALRAAAVAHLGGARTPAGAHLAVRFALRELGDRHSYLQAPAAVRALEAAAVGNALTRQPPRAPAGWRLAGGVVRLSVPGFAGGTHAEQVEFAESVKKLIQDHDKEAVCGWVVDLRDNRGGNLWPMLVGLGPLLGEGELAASVYPDGRRTPVWYRAGQGGFGDYVQLRVAQPYRLAREAPVALLIGPGTASSAEVLVVAFRGRAETRSFGAPTSGVSAGNRIFPLADGAALVLTVAATSDRFGLVHAGPIEPDEAVAVGAVGQDRALEAARAWLAGSAACR